MCAVEDAVAERTEPLPWGTAVFHARVPWVREVNVVRVEATSSALTAGDIAFAAEQRFPAAPAVEVLHEPIGAALAPAFAAAGWQVSRHLLMALEQPPPAQAAVAEVSPDDVWPLREEWMRSEPWGDDDAVAAMLRWERHRALLTGARAFCAFADGRPVSMCLLLATAHADEVERVYTTPSATRSRPRLRGRRARRARDRRAAHVPLHRRARRRPAPLRAARVPPRLGRV